MLSYENQTRAQTGWQARERLIRRVPALAEALEKAAPQERPLLQWTAASLPATDLGDYPPGLLLSFVREALAARESFPWARALPEEIFLLYVLGPRVNNEGLCDCRPLFRRELEPLVKGLSLTEAIQRVNVWCAEHVAYRSTDGRTSTPLEIFRRGWGRCGEESVFAVNALRSVGIPARQLYAPWWSHCDDNHAWVEAWDGEKWRYLGACEPEPLLDMGWFTQAAGRAALIHTRAFLGDLPAEGLFPGVPAERLGVREGVAYESVTSRYAPVRSLEVEALAPGGKPAAGAEITLYILNEGALRAIASRTAGGDGRVRVELGLGSVWLTAALGGLEANCLVDADSPRAVLRLGEPALVSPGAVDFAAPRDAGVKPIPLTPEQRAGRAAVLEEARARRGANQSPAPCPPAAGPALLRAYAALTEKDRAVEVPPAVLEDAQGAFRWEGKLPEEIFEEGLLPQRLGHEPLAPWRAMLSAQAPDLPPAELWRWLCENITPLNSFTDVPQTPAGAWRLGAAHGPGLRGLFCAVCRSKGVPARLGAAGLPEYWQDGRWLLADGRAAGDVKITHNNEGGRSGLMRWDGAWLPCGAGRLPEGRYLWAASARLPNGNQLAELRGFRLEAGARVEIAPEFREAGPEEFLQCLELPESALGGGLRGLLRRRGLALLCWTDPGAEPTQHLLLELSERLAELEGLGCGPVFLTEPGRGREGLPEGAEVLECEGQAAEAVARRMYLEPGVMPLAVLADGEGRGLFALAGYRVGAGEMLAAVARAAKGRKS